MKIRFWIILMGFLILSCYFPGCVLDAPTEMGRENPNDGRNPDAIPEILSLNTDMGNGFTNQTNANIHIQTRLTNEIRIAEVASQGADLNADWQDADTVLNVHISGGDGEKWIGCQGKALNGRVSETKYTSINLDTRVEISSFTWSSTSGDTLVPDDRISFVMQTSVDAFGAETGGNASVTVEGWDPIDLIGHADGSYTGSYTITRDTPEVSNARVTVSLTDRAGNEIAHEAEQRLTAWWTIPPGTERDFPLGATGQTITMCWIPPGSFNMGSPDGEQDRDNDEGPVHRVMFAEGFWISKYEITQGQWQAVMGENPAHDRGIGENYPVYYVSWNDIQEFESALGNTFRLPSEAEWEYACRAGTTTRFYWGNDLTYNQIWYYAWFNSNSGGRTHEVGWKVANNWGLHDMSGNVWEWCEDVWHNDYYGAPRDGSAWLDGGNQSRCVLRGSSWSYVPRSCRCAFRFWLNKSDRLSNSGFRVVFRR